MKKSLYIEGMNCGHCSASVEKALKAVDGVMSASVDLAAKRASIEADAAVSTEALKKAVIDAGFQVSKVE